MYLNEGGIQVDIQQLPQVLKDFFNASNLHHLDAYLDTFSENAIVFDEGQEHRGKIAIKNWIEKPFKAHVTNDPVTAIQSNDEIIVTCKVDGDFDKTGLADPLLLRFNFKVNEGKIVELLIKE